MKDFIDQQLEVGDRVVCTAQRYHELIKGTIVKLTPRFVRVKVDKEYENWYNSGEALKAPNQLIKISK